MASAGLVQVCTSLQTDIGSSLKIGWLGSRVVNVLDSGAEGPGFKSQPRRCRVSLTQTVHTHRASVHQAAKLAAALLRIPRVTAGLAESNGSLPPGLWLTPPAGWLPRTGISFGNRVWATFFIVETALFRTSPHPVHESKLPAYNITCGPGQCWRSASYQCAVL